MRTKQWHATVFVGIKCQSSWIWRHFWGLQCVFLSSSHFLSERKKDVGATSEYPELIFIVTSYNCSHPPPAFHLCLSVLYLWKEVSQLLQTTAGGTQRSAQVSDKWVQIWAVYPVFVYILYPCRLCIHFPAVYIVCYCPFFYLKCTVQLKGFSKFWWQEIYVIRNALVHFIPVSSDMELTSTVILTNSIFLQIYDNIWSICNLF